MYSTQQLVAYYTGSMILVQKYCDAFAKRHDVLTIISSCKKDACTDKPLTIMVMAWSWHMYVLA